jgi:hypothetical protein
MLHHLLYLSSARAKFAEAALRGLLAVARNNNTVNGISGMLLYSDGNFIQYLEGEQDQVRATFDRIRRDGRHTGVFVVSEGAIEQRVFADWSMGFEEVDADAHDELGLFRLSREAIRDRLGADAPELLMAMMQRFYDGTNRFAYS